MTRAHSPSWDVTYLTAEGAKAKGRMFVNSLSAVRHEVAQRRGVLLHASPRQKRLLEKELFSANFRVAFLNGLKFHVDAGASPGQALALMVQTQKDGRIRSELNGALDILERGGSFTEALAALSLFDEAVIGMLSAGELSGNVPEAIKAAQAYVEERAGWWKAWKPFAFWLGTEVSTALYALYWLATSFIPGLQSNLPASDDKVAVADYSATLAQALVATQVVFWVSVAMLAAITGLVFAYRFGSAQWHDRAEQWLMNVPGMRSLLLDASLAFSFGLAAHMLKARLRFSEVLPLVARYAKVPSVRRFWETALHRLSLGASLPRAFEHRFIEPGEVIVLNAHQDTEQLVYAMALIARRRSEAAATGRRYALWLYGMLAGIYLAGIALLAVWLVKLQGAGLSMTSMEGVMGF